MNGQKIGYVRVSTVEQNESRQLDDLQLDKIFTDKCSGSKKDRPQFNIMLDYLREGDTLYIHSIDRLARNLFNLQEVVNLLVDKGVKIKFIKENLEFTGDDNPISKLTLNIMGSFAEFERSLIRERQKEGIAQAKKKGVYKGRKPSLSEEDKAKIKYLFNAKKQTAEGLARNYKVTRRTIYNVINSDVEITYQSDIEDYTR